MSKKPAVKTTNKIAPISPFPGPAKTLQELLRHKISYLVCWKQEIIRPKIIVPENKPGFLSTLAGFFFPGTLKKKPCYLNELLVNFRKEFSRIGRFCRIEVPTDGQLAQFRFFDRNKVNLQAACFVV